MISNAFIDLDGTILDYRNRMYKVFQSIFKNDSLTIEEYWKLKRRKFSNYQIAWKYFSPLKIEAGKFEQLWLNKIESHRFLALDTVIAGTETALDRLTKTHSLYVVTARQDREATIDQIRKLRLNGFFKDILVTQHKQSKAALLASVKRKSEFDLIVGDTGEDTIAGRAAGLRCFSVLSGIRDGDILGTYSPDAIFENLLELAFTLSKVDMRR